MRTSNRCSPWQAHFSSVSKGVLASLVLILTYGDGFAQDDRDDVGSADSPIPLECRNAEDVRACIISCIPESERAVFGDTLLNSMPLISLAEISGGTCVTSPNETPDLVLSDDVVAPGGSDALSSASSAPWNWTAETCPTTSADLQVGRDTLSTAVADIDQVLSEAREFRLSEISSVNTFSCNDDGTRLSAHLSAILSTDIERLDTGVNMLEQCVMAASQRFAAFETRGTGLTALRRAERDRIDEIRFESLETLQTKIFLVDYLKTAILTDIIPTFQDCREFYSDSVSQSIEIPEAFLTP